MIRFFGRTHAAAAVAEAVPQLATRAAVSRCFACHQSTPPYVYAENEKDYCLPCATDSYAILGLRPGGRRVEDPTLEALIRFDAEQANASDPVMRWASAR